MTFGYKEAIKTINAIQHEINERIVEAAIK